MDREDTWVSVSFPFSWRGDSGQRTVGVYSRKERRYPKKDTISRTKILKYPLKIEPFLEETEFISKQ